MRCYLCPQPAVTECCECRRPVCHTHTKRGNPRDTRYNGGIFSRHDYCSPCYDSIREDTIKLNCLCAIIIIPFMILCLLAFGFFH